jgi:recombination protein RecA
MGTVAELSSALLDAIGENSGNQAVTKFIDTGYPPLNEAMSGRYDGGLPFGRMVEMFGESSTGKTALATEWMVKAQQMGGVAGFIDWERSFDVGLAEGFGLKTERPHWIYAKPKTWEEGNMIAGKAARLIRQSKVISDDAPILFVFDSIASAIPQSMLTDGKGKEKQLDELTMNDTSALARVSSTTLKVMAQYCDDYNATFLYLNQIRLKIGVVFGDPRTTPGGKAMEYYSTCRLALGRTKIMEQHAGEKEFVGQNVSIQCTKSKLTRPFKSCEIRLSFDEDGVARFSPTYSLIEHLVAAKVLAAAGQRVVWTDGKQYYKKALAEKIDSEGIYSELVALLPPL